MITEIYGGAKDGQEIEIHKDDLEADQIEIEDTWYSLNRETGKLEIVK